MNSENLDDVDDTAKKQQIVWKPNVRTAQFTLNNIREAAACDHERSQYISLIRLQVEELITSTVNKYYPRARRSTHQSEIKVNPVELYASVISTLEL
ncbi:2755_t:CDS:2 [Acaulospora morrowiae]|uniref:2755_t:CDS:1 n=1 Tax=Acaulospora morrowiae TaxID=94023 RepID=A0A9N9EK34_9GLOM|nr:2755_t:CDS:2 [Acaulospora morrowiae]